MIRFRATLIACLAFAGAPIARSEVDIGPRLRDRAEMLQKHAEVRLLLHDPGTRRRLAAWLNHEKAREYVVDCQFKLRPFVKSESVIGPLCYLLRQDDAARRAQSITLLRRYWLEMKLALRDIAEDPRYPANLKQKAQTIFGYYDSAEHWRSLEQCFSRALSTRYQADGSLPFTPFQEVGSCLNSNLPRVGGVAFIGANLEEEFPAHPGHAVSDTGWIPGNKVTYTDVNDVSAEFGARLAEKSNLMQTRYPLNGRGSVDSFRRAEPSAVFTSAEGFTDVANDPAWSQTTGIYPMILEAINGARETIFIDVFFLGGTMGASMAKHLVKLVEERPGLKVFILRDNLNHFGHAGEMLPVFNFLHAYMFRHPDRIVALSSHIKSHRTGLPPFMDRVITEEFLKRSGLESHLSLYGRAVSDHSKVVVVDGTSSRPVALVGSKNWTNVSGAWGFDDVARIDGPAAAIVLDDYYRDMAMALDREISQETLTLIATRGWSRSAVRSGDGKAQMIAAILKPFDLLDRDASGTPRRSGAITMESRGEVSARTGFNDVDSTRTNCVDQVIQAIHLARNRIRIKEQFLFDRNVVLALINAKRRTPGLDIKIILEPLSAANPPGIPNTLYLDVLTAAGVEIRWKKKLSAANLEQDYHHKSLSTDGRFLITGSANKDQTTMYGSFREEQVHLDDPVATGIHDASFDAQWRDDTQSEPFGGFNFPVPQGLKGFDGQPLQPGEFIRLLRGLVATLYDAQSVNR